VCSVCEGKGIAELSSAKWTYRYPAVLAVMLAVVAFLTLWVAMLRSASDDFAKVLVFVSTLTGSITGYYFGGTRAMARNRTLSHRTVPARNPNQSDPAATERPH
jgi:hypothetical protein